MAFTWSYSALSSFETCPKQYWHLRVAKDVVEPPSPYLEEGNRLHSAFDARIRKGTPLPTVYAMHEPMLDKLVKAPGETLSETKMALTRNLTPSPYFGPEVWMRTVIDAAKIRDTDASIFDWKTGKPKEDTTQLALMAGTLFAYRPELMTVKAALVFVGYTETVRQDFHRDTMGEQWNEIFPRVRDMEVSVGQVSFPPKPSGLCKRYCPVSQCPHHRQ